MHPSELLAAIDHQDELEAGVDQVWRFARSCRPLGEGCLPALGIETQSEMPGHRGDFVWLQPIEALEIRIYLRINVEKPEKLGRPLDNEHRLESGVAVLGIDRLQDELLR